MKRLTSKKGFTLIELIVVIAILAILAAILIPAIINYIETANLRRDQTNARSAYTQVQLEQSTIPGTYSTGNTVTVQSGGAALSCVITTDANQTVITLFSCTGGSFGTEAYEITELSVTTSP